MEQEFEAKFLGINPDDLRKKLVAHGARQIHPERIMRRTVYDFPDGNLDAQGAWARVRDERERVTLTFKQVTGAGIEDVREIELVVDDFEKAEKLLTALGCEQKAYQETKREKWTLNGAKITIDTWPGLQPFLEIEAADEETVKAVAARLDFDYRNALFGSVDIIYERELGIPPQIINNETPLLTFDHPPARHAPPT